MNQPGFWTLHKTNKLAANKPIVFLIAIKLNQTLRFWRGFDDQRKEAKGLTFRK